MLRPDRQSNILKSLDERALDGGGVCRVSDLAVSLGVSAETVRRDIKLMVSEGLVRKVHGGVALLDEAREPAFRQRLHENAQAKKAIAMCAAREVHDGDSIMLDTGSTTSYVAEALVGHRYLTVMTNSVDIANTLATRNGNRVFMAGGELRADDGAVLGGGAVAFIEQFRAHIAFLSVGAIDLEDGLMDYHMSEAEFSRMVIERADRAIVVADRSKLGLRALVRIAGFDAIDTLITDSEPYPAFARKLQRDEVRIVAAAKRT